MISQPLTIKYLKNNLAALQINQKCMRAIKKKELEKGYKTKCSSKQRMVSDKENTNKFQA